MMMNQDQAKSLRELVNKNKEMEKPTPLVEEKSQVEVPEIYAFAGIVEGVGNTTIASNLANLISRENKRVILIDFNSDFLTTDLYFNIIPNYSIDRLIDKGKDKKEMLTKARDNIYTIYASKILRASIQEKLAFRERISSVISDADCVIIDIYGVQNLEIVDFLLKRAKIILTAVPTAEGIKSAYYGIKHFNRNMDVGEIGVIINKASKKIDADKVFEKLKFTVAEFLEIEIKNFGYISTRDEIKESVKNQELFTEKNLASASVEELSSIRKVLSN